LSLSKEQIAHFKNHGYTAVPDFFTAREVQALQAEVERFKREGLVRNVATDGDGETHSKTKANLQLIPLHDKSDLIRALPFDDKVTNATAQLIGAPFVLHLDQMFLKPAGHGIGTDWHQDNAYFKISDPLKGTAMWVAVHDASIANGTIHVVHDSFKEQYPHDRDPNSDHHIHCQVPEERAVPIELKAGGVVFFCYGTAHSTKANTTDRDRAGIAFHFLHGDCVDRANLVDKKRGQPFLLGPETTGGEAEYGERVAGTWDQEIERVLQETNN
jgi:ectoine hydroxylase-related dioxygenase (phytanoyl-CoA dioxygenase family)